MTKTRVSTRHMARMAAIGATAALTAPIFILPARAETDAKAIIKT